MSDWHIKIRDEVVGPISGRELLERVRSGEVTPETLIRKGSSQWVLAEEVNGLFEAIGQKAVEYHCPECGEKVRRPPTQCEFCGAVVEQANLQRFAVRPTRSAAPDRVDGGGGAGGTHAPNWRHRLRELWQWLTER